MEKKRDEAIFTALTFAISAWIMSGVLFAELTEKGLIDDKTLERARAQAKMLGELLGPRLGYESIDLNLENLK